MVIKRQSQLKVPLQLLFQSHFCCIQKDIDQLFAAVTSFNKTVKVIIDNMLFPHI